MSDIQPDAEGMPGGALEASVADENHSPDVDVPEPVEDAPESLSEPDTGEPDTFPRDYVESLRKENQTYRLKAKEAEQSAADANVFAEGFAKRLHTLMVKATGRLADPADLPYQVEHLMDDAALDAAIDSLLAEKPHFAAPKKPSGDVGQGRRGPSAGFSILDVLKSHA